MEKTPQCRSVSKYYELTNVEHLSEYCGWIERIANNSHKYYVVDNGIRLDMFGNPFVILQMKEILDVEEKKKKTFSFFAEIISIASLDRFDSLVTDHWDQKIVITFIQEWSNKDKKHPMHYKILIYYKLTENNILKEETAKSLMPKDKRQ